MKNSQAAVIITSIVMGALVLMFMCCVGASLLDEPNPASGTTYVWPSENRGY